MSLSDWKPRFCARRCAILVMLACITLVFSSALAGRRRKYPLAEKLNPIPTQPGISGRQLFRFPHGECIVFRAPILLVGEEEQRQYRGTDEDAELVRQRLPATSRWHIPPDRPEKLTTFNCATFAIGDVIGLSRADWLPPQVVSGTRNQNPTDVLLQEFFFHLVTYPLAGIQWRELDTLESLNDDDVIVFAIHGSREKYIHLGRVDKRNGRNRMISKLGGGPIVRSTIQRTAQEYEGAFTEIQVYRRR